MAGVVAGDDYNGKLQAACKPLSVRQLEADGGDDRSSPFLNVPHSTPVQLRNKSPGDVSSTTSEEGGLEKYRHSSYVYAGKLPDICCDPYSDDDVYSDYYENY